MNAFPPFCYKLTEDRRQPSVPLSRFLIKSEILLETTTRASMACDASWKKRNAYRILWENLTGWTTWKI